MMYIDAQGMAAMPGAAAADTRDVNVGSAQPPEAPGALSQPEAEPQPQGSGPRLAALWVYPIKSCGGCSVQRWPLGPNGLLLDREWALVGPEGSALTQKGLPALASITPRLDLAAGKSTLLCSCQQSHTGSQLSLEVTGTRCMDCCTSAQKLLAGLVCWCITNLPADQHGCAPAQLHTPVHCLLRQGVLLAAGATLMRCCGQHGWCVCGDRCTCTSCSCTSHQHLS